MAVIVGVHGIAQQYKGAETSDWLGSLRDGLRLAGRERGGDGAGESSPALPEADDLTMAFWGDLFRPAGGKSPGDLPPWDVHDVDDGAEEGLEAELLKAWWVETSKVDENVPKPDEDLLAAWRTGDRTSATAEDVWLQDWWNAASDGSSVEEDVHEGRAKARTSAWKQEALMRLSESRFFAGWAERMFVGALKQVVAYVNDPDMRRDMRQRVEEQVADDTRVMVGHSLGSVIAYEALCAHPEWPVTHLVTLGSPLGIPNVIFDRLDPVPVNGRGVRPPGIESWTNIADQGDVVALRKELDPIFDGPVTDVLVHNGPDAHSIVPYLTAVETGRAIRSGLVGML